MCGASHTLEPRHPSLEKKRNLGKKRKTRNVGTAATARDHGPAQVLYYHNDMLYYDILSFPILYYSFQSNTMILRYDMLYYTILYVILLYYDMLYYDILYFTMICYTILYSFGRISLSTHPLHPPPTVGSSIRAIIFCSNLVFLASLLTITRCCCSTECLALADSLCICHRNIGGRRHSCLCPQLSGYYSSGKAAGLCH